MKLRLCKGCGRSIVWARSPSGGRIPLQPATRRVFYLTPKPDDDWMPQAHVVISPSDAMDEIIYVSHMIICPKRGEGFGPDPGENDG